METDLNKEESAETSIFINFSIREYVAEIRKKNPAKCWPFGSLHVVSSYQSSESTFLSGQNCTGDINGSENITELTEVPNLSKVANFNRKVDRPEATIDMIGSLGVDSDMVGTVYNGSSELTFCNVNNGQIRQENSVDGGAKIRHNEAADNSEPGRNRQQRKSKKFRLLSDIYKDPASELRACCDRTNLGNVNRRFVAEIDDESDDNVTLAAYFRKQKGVEITDTILKNKRDMIGVEEPSVDMDKQSKNGSKDSIGKGSNVGTSRKKNRTNDMDTQTMPEHKKDFWLHCSQKSDQIAEVCSKDATENEDSEMEAVMLLARHFNEQKQILRELETNPTCECVKKKIREHSTQSGGTKTSSKTATKYPVTKVTKEKLENGFCSAQRMSFTAVTGGRFQSHNEMSMMKALGVGSDAQNRATRLCSFNRNPADFSIPYGGNKFMRGG